jgi:chemotaxis signal transduction protein
MEAHLGFRVGGVALAIEASLAQAVEASAGLITVPFARRCVAGVLVREGRAVCVVDLAEVPALWNEVPRGGGERVIVIGSGEVEAGFLADAVEAFTPGGAAEAAPPERIRESLLRGMVRSTREVYGLLQAQAALNAAGIPGMLL